METLGWLCGRKMQIVSQSVGNTHTHTQFHPSMWACPCAEPRSLQAILAMGFQRVRVEV